MAVPYRDFTDFHHISAHGLDLSGGANYNVPADWANDHVEIPIVGARKISAVIWERYDLFYKGTEAQGWGELSGADKVMSVCLTFSALPPFFNQKPMTALTWIRRGCLYRAPDDWNIISGTGRYTDGLSAEYFSYPHNYYGGDQVGIYSNIPVPAAPTTMQIWQEAWGANVNHPLSYNQSSSILTRGMILGISSFTPSSATWGNGDGIFLNLSIHHVKMKYFNPTCNSLSRYGGPSAGGFELKLYGLGLHNDDDEIDEGGVSRVTAGAGSWNDYVDYIYIEDLEGNVVSTLQVDVLGNPGSRQFTYGSNTEITIYSFPALPAGIYQLRMVKDPAADSYAGDWRCDEAGRMSEGDRLYIVIGDEEIPPGPPRGKWRFKGGDYIYRYYAPIDVRSPLTFYEGMVLGMSSWTRGTNDDSGLPLLPDCEVELDNTSQEFSKLLADYWAKDQPVEIFYSWAPKPDVAVDMIYRGLVADYDLPHSTWRVKLKSTLDKYLATVIPKYRCTVDEFPDIHPNHVNRPMPEVLGRASLAEGSTPGAVEAIYVDIVNHEYLAARGALHAVTEVYADAVLIDPADYVVVYKDGGRTYIDFDDDQGDAKITFNAEGYMYEDWDSTDDFVQNPIYIMLFVLTFFFEVWEDDIDIDSFDTLAAEYEALGYGQSAYLILQDEKDDAASVLQELLWTFGAKLWTTMDGLVRVGRKDVTDLTYEHLYHDQIDTLNEVEKATGFEKAVNYAPISWNYFPTANYFTRGKLVTHDASIEMFEAELMPGSPWAFPWTNDEALVNQRVDEELGKHAFGDYRIRFDMSIEHINELDILDTFAYQDPFALNALGEGTVAKLYYVERITYDFDRGTMTVEAIDMDYILRAYFVTGDELAQAANWADASEADKLYGYLCDEVTGAFADGQPGKKLIDENIGG